MTQLLPAVLCLASSRLLRGLGASIALRWRAIGGALLLLLVSACSSLPPLPPRTASYAWAQPQHTPLGQLVQQQRQQARAPYPSGFSLLGGADAAFTSRLALVEHAAHTLDLQYYAIHADPSSARLLQAVVQAAQRGVRVRVLLDDFHSAGQNAQVMQLAFVPGIEMRMFNPLTGPRGSTVLRALSTLADFQRTQQRMHNKLFIADNVIGITGGRNLGDAYFDALDSDNFIDLDIMACGEVVRQLSHSFDRYWNDSRAYPAQALVSQTQLQRMATAPEPQPAATSAPTTSPPAASVETPAHTAVLQAMDLQQVRWIWAPALVMADAPTKILWPTPDDAALPEAEGADGAPVFTPVTGLTPPQPSPTSGILAGLAALVRPHSTRSPNQQALGTTLPALAAQDNVVDGLLTLIAQAQRDILIVSPYFVPGPDMKRAFAQAVARGVQVRLLTNSLASNDAPLAHAGYARHRQALLDMGVQLYELRSLQGGQNAPHTLRDSAKQVTGSVAGSRAMLHSKMIVIDGLLTVVGSMNLDLRSQLHNTEIALLIASRRLAQEASDNIEASLRSAAWSVQSTPQGLVWRAPAEADWMDRTREPDASLPLRWLIRLIGPLAPDHLL